ncbi:hypothetical protein FNV43_RR08892 [Rhamnella rubrinervis]|uniref:Uncharacterized protein n=1 Tax=Rhamnella rubrinervis TaxID=2594499 RepID=A0A8K0H9E6_9ROSA|nr:hypothetical protein FNV43_RR08892 [Rhamnella rubrinervis]
MEQRPKAGPRAVCAGVVKPGGRCVISGSACVLCDEPDGASNPEWSMEQQPRMGPGHERCRAFKNPRGRLLPVVAETPRDSGEESRAAIVPCGGGACMHVPAWRQPRRRGHKDENIGISGISKEMQTIEAELRMERRMVQIESMLQHISQQLQGLLVGTNRQHVRDPNGGLRETLRLDVEMQNPHNLAHAMNLARAYEKKQQQLTKTSISLREQWPNSSYLPKTMTTIATYISCGDSEGLRTKLVVAGLVTNSNDAIYAHLSRRLSTFELVKKD